MFRFTLVNTRWGAFTFVSNGPELVATFLPVRSESITRRTLHRQWPAAVDDQNALLAFQQDVIAYYEGDPVAFKVDLALGRLTEFRRGVTLACRRIPYGSTATYHDLARAVGRPRASRALGRVMAVNPLPLVIPCHRVVRSDGTLGGFSSPQGIKQKQRMLALEQLLQCPG